MIQPLWRTVWRFLKKLKIELPYDPAIPLLDIYPEKTLIQKDTCTPMLIVALFTIARSWNQPKCPLTDEWIKNIYHLPLEGGRIVIPMVVLHDIKLCYIIKTLYKTLCRDCPAGSEEECYLEVRGS